MVLGFVVFTILMVAVAGYFVYRNRTAVVATLKADESKVSASAKAVAIEGKLLAFKALATVKAEEAKVVHASLDEIDKLL